MREYKLQVYNKCQTAEREVCQIACMHPIVSTRIDRIYNK